MKMPEGTKRESVQLKTNACNHGIASVFGRCSSLDSRRDPVILSLLRTPQSKRETARDWNISMAEHASVQKHRNYRDDCEGRSRDCDDRGRITKDPSSTTASA